MTSFTGQPLAKSHAKDLSKFPFKLTTLAGEEMQTSFYKCFLVTGLYVRVIRKFVTSVTRCKEIFSRKNIVWIFFQKNIMYL